MSLDNNNTRSVCELPRIDYKILKKKKTQENLEVTEISLQLSELQVTKMDNFKILESKYALVKEEIDDFIDENPINHTIFNADDVDICIEKVTDFRCQFRQICKDIQNPIPTENMNPPIQKKLLQFLQASTNT